MKVIIAGGRDFNDYEKLKTCCDFTLQNYSEIEIVSGGARGADALGEKYAEEKGYPIKKFPADWGKHGKAAGPIRNRQMVDYAEALIVFWDGKSRGTRNVIDESHRNNLKVRVSRY